jgi:hypothetical protein
MDYTTQAVLYEAGAYNDYIFSQDGRWLAVAIDRRADVWDTQTGQLNVTFTPDSTLGIEGPLWFADDASLLVFNSRNPAPQSIRRSENDTVLTPWVWDVQDARDEARSTLPNLAQAVALFDYRNGLILSAGNQYIAGLPGRLNILNIDTEGIRIVNTIDDPNRLEVDPIEGWRSASTGQLYVRTRSSATLYWLDPATGSPAPVPLGREMQNNTAASIGDYPLSALAQIIGEAHSTTPNSLTMALLGANYRADYDYRPLTIMLLDVLTPITPTAGPMGLLVLIRDEARGITSIDFLRPPAAMQMALHPDGTRLAIRQSDGAQPINEYDLATGNLIASYYPTFDDFDGTTFMAYDATGSALIGDFERWDTGTQAVTFIDEHAFTSFDNFYFSTDNEKLLTLNRNQLDTWEIATGALLRREYLSVRGDVLDVSSDGQRYLTRIQTASGIGIEVVDMGSDEWHTVLFETLPGREIASIIPNDTWDNFIVVYTPYLYTQHYPGYELALYNLYTGKQWFIAGDDLPAVYDGSSFGWLADNTTAFVVADTSFSSAPERIYGIEYDPSGIPACLNAFDDDSRANWMLLWERLNAFYPSDSVHRASQAVCLLVQAGGNAADVDTYFTPVPTATVIFPTPRPVVIPGVPACLTQRFSSEALQYAENWRAITDGLSQPQIDELALLLCEGLSGDASPNRFSSSDSPVQVMTIDITTGQRQLLSSLPLQSRAGFRSIDLVFEAYSQRFRRYPDDARLSPDGNLFAVSDFPLIKIYRIADGYDGLAATATATIGVVESSRMLSVRPTATALPEYLGEPRPTLTPTMTMTPPPTPAATTSALSAVQTVTDSCPTDHRYTLSDLPPEYAPTGDLVTFMVDQPFRWYARFNPVTGDYHPAEFVPGREFCFDCIYSYAENWILRTGGDTSVMRADGTDRRILFREAEAVANPYTITWIAPDTLEFEYRTFLPAESPDEVTLRQHYNVTTATYSEAFRLPDTLRVNELDTEVVAYQPVLRRWAVVRTSFKGASDTGYKYYLLDTATQTLDYFARLVDAPTNIVFEWHPLGQYLYYQYPTGGDWLIFDPATGEHRLLGTYPNGTWSRDARYKIAALEYSQAELYEYEDAGKPVPHLTIWDSTTGLTRNYCIPEVEAGRFGAALFTSDWQWSPDNRYVAFQVAPPAMPNAEVQRGATLILDTQTGYVVTLGDTITAVHGWLEAAR